MNPNPTRQDVFDACAEHLLTQMERSASTPTHLATKCYYRHPDGVKSCAVGVLIPDSLYRPEMELYSVCHLVLDFELPEYFTTYNELLHALQLLHDRCWPAMWALGLVEIAAEHGLDPCVVERLVQGQENSQ